MQFQHYQNEKYSSVNIIIVLIRSFKILTIQHWHHLHQNQVGSLPCGGLRGQLGLGERIWKAQRAVGAGPPRRTQLKEAGTGWGRACRAPAATPASSACEPGCRDSRWGKACSRPGHPAPHPSVPSCLSTLTGLSHWCLGKGGQRSKPRTRHRGAVFWRQPSLRRTSALRAEPRGICRAAISRLSPSRSTRASPQPSLCVATHLLLPPSYTRSF